MAIEKKSAMGTTGKQRPAANRLNNKPAEGVEASKPSTSKKLTIAKLTRAKLSTAKLVTLRKFGG